LSEFYGKRAFKLGNDFPAVPDVANDRVRVIIPDGFEERVKNKARELKTPSFNWDLLINEVREPSAPDLSYQQ
jgi:hypothetical protein